MVGLTVGGVLGGDWPLHANVFLLGVANGAFSIGAIGSMMQLASQGQASREGVRMGLWGAAQAIAFGIGGLVGTAASDLAHLLIASPGGAYASVFALEAALFVVSAAMAWHIASVRPSQRTDPSADPLRLPHHNDRAAAPT
jgi:BCD family chlorophyll transporter-like MFS transporter